MKEHKLWSMVSELKSPKYKWVELSHEVSPETPRWVGYPALTSSRALDFHEEPYDVIADLYNIVGQYGTHVDCQRHFVDGGLTLEQLDARQMLYPLCVLDVTEKVKQNPDYEVTIDDILEWEDQYGNLQEGCFLALRTDWGIITKGDYQNNDEQGNPHYPGWKLETLHFLHEKRNIAAIGHETTDTDAPAAGLGWAGELYWLQQEKIQIEVMINLCEVPPVGAIIFCSWPRVKDGAGFTARCVAIFEEE